MRGSRMKKFKVAVIDLVTNGPKRSWYARIMYPNNASIMCQVVAVWCRQAGHEVEYICYTGFEDVFHELPDDVDMVFVGAFTHAALLSYAISNYFRKKRAVTVLGGPHARSYPEDACKYFDYVLGFTDKRLILDVLSDCKEYRPSGIFLKAKDHPNELPSVEERWEFINATLNKVRGIKIVPLISSFGCPYNCSFCIDSTVDFQPLSYEQLTTDLRFIMKNMKYPQAGWQDPNFGVQFDKCMDAIEEAVPANSVQFIAESSLSLLTESHCRRMQKIGFKAILPGIESWQDFGNKSKSGNLTGEKKLQEVAQQVNMILRYIPFVQTNFLLGLDIDKGKEPFELTKRFVDLCPGAFPLYQLFTSYGESTLCDLDLQQAGRIIPFPFHFLNNFKATNIQPLNYTWTELYDHIINLLNYSFSWRNIYRRFIAQGPDALGMMNVLRSLSSDRHSRLSYLTRIRKMLDTDQNIRTFFEGKTEEIPEFYIECIRQELGPFWHYLPEESIDYDPYIYLKKTQFAENRK
jgi:hypothetical protein